MLKILLYIIQHNSSTNIPKYIFLGLIYQLYKRLTNGVISKKLFNNQKILLFPKCTISTMYAYTAIPDEKEIMLLRRLALSSQKKAIFLDIGSNIGSYSVCMMDVCAHIIAFEPHPFTANRCKMNFLLNNFQNDNVQQLALSNKIGKIYFSDYGSSSTINHILEDTRGIEVNVTTLDYFIQNNHYLIESPFILKVDVEGFEKNVFEGGKNFLMNYNILGIVFECFIPKDVFGLLNSYGYTTIQKLSENNYFATKN